MGYGLWVVVDHGLWDRSGGLWVMGLRVRVSASYCVFTPILM